MKKLLSAFLAFVFVLTLLLSLGGNFVLAEEEPTSLTILFTHDLHSHILPSSDGKGGSVGGFARLMTAIKTQKDKDPDALLVDGGDFSMGSVFQSVYATQAVELRLMGAMGYDAAAIGNHEFDYFTDGFAKMLTTAKKSGDKLPALLVSNFLPFEKGSKHYSEELSKAWEAFGVEPFVILEKKGVPIILLGLFGDSAKTSTPNATLAYTDPIQTAKTTLAAAKEACQKAYPGKTPFVICLSHSGTEGGKGEDYRLAQEVPEIDLIVSGHTHTLLDKPIVVGQSYIVSVGEYGQQLGSVRFEAEGDDFVLADHAVIPINQDIPEDEEIAALVQKFALCVEEETFASFGLAWDETLVRNPYLFETSADISASLHESPLANLVTDAYRYAAEQATGEKVDVALTAAGLIRDTLPQGDIKAGDLFGLAALGVGTEGELLSFYLTGKDLKLVLDIGGTLPTFVSTLQFFYSGVHYRVNRLRLPLNQVEEAALLQENGSLVPIEDDKLYHMVIGSYCGSMFQTVKDKSFGLFSVTPRDKEGNPLPFSEVTPFVIRLKDGQPLKEWYAIASYLQTMDGEMDAKYAATDGRVEVYESAAPTALLVNWNIFTWIPVILLLVIVALIALAVVKKCRKGKVQK